jgi:hypothetical protein
MYMMRLFMGVVRQQYMFFPALLAHEAAFLHPAIRLCLVNAETVQVEFLAKAFVRLIESCSGVIVEL